MRAILFGLHNHLAASCSLVFLLFLAGMVTAQDITVNNNLVFGPVFSGIPKIIAKTVGGEAAEFQITGTAGAEISLEFALPSYMHTNGANMRMVFSATDCALDSSATPNQTNPPVTDLNPYQTITYRLGSTGVTIWLGATVIPAVSQKPGDYDATITLTVAYTGN